MNIFNMFGAQGNKMQQMMQQLQQDPRAMIQQSGLQIPEEMIGNPQEMVMHLISSGQVSGPMMQRIMPMIQQINRK